jgi:hypothetical protein
MTARQVQLDFPSSRRPLPQIFDRLVVIVAVQAHLFALIEIFQSRSAYRSVPVCLILWLVSAMVPLACVVAARRAGGVLSARAFLTAVGLLLVVDVALPVLVPTAERAGAAMWNWGAVGVTLLTFAAFRPLRDVLILAAGHTLIGVAVTATAFGLPGAGAFSLLVVANAAATPALAAAQYLSGYIRAVRLRERAVGARREIEIRHAASQAVQADAAARLGALQAEVIPLLTSVATGSAAVDDEQVARTARRLAGEIRRELVEARSGSWLLPAAPSAAAGNGADAWPGIVLLDPRRLLARLQDADRAALIVLVGALRRHSGWHRVSVALTPGDTSHARTGEPAATPSSATLTVVATGPPAATAARDVDVIAAARRLTASVEADSATVFVAEAALPLARTSLISSGIRA